jgi:hypothetical protein
MPVLGGCQILTLEAPLITEKTPCMYNGYIYIAKTTSALLQYNLLGRDAWWEKSWLCRLSVAIFIIYILLYSLRIFTFSLWTPSVGLFLAGVEPVLQGHSFFYLQCLYHFCIYLWKKRFSHYGPGILELWHTSIWFELQEKFQDQITKNVFLYCWPILAKTAFWF